MQETMWQDLFMFLLVLAVLGIVTWYVASQLAAAVPIMHFTSLCTYTSQSGTRWVCAIGNTIMCSNGGGLCFPGICNYNPPPACNASQNASIRQNKTAWIIIN